MKQIAIFTVILALTGCQSREEKYPVAADYCEEEQRKVPALEKKVRVLSTIYKRGFAPEYIKALVAENAGDGQNNAKDAEKIIAKFVRENPRCCQILKPDHVGERVFNNEAFLDDALDDEREWGYIGDIYIFYYRPFKEIGPWLTLKDTKRAKVKLPDGRISSRRSGSPLMLNACGEFKGFNRG